jgi:hypothetical protein
MFSWGFFIAKIIIRRVIQNSAAVQFFLMRKFSPCGASRTQETAVLSASKVALLRSVCLKHLIKLAQLFTRRCGSYRVAPKPFPLLKPKVLVCASLTLPPSVCWQAGKEILRPERFPISPGWRM